MKPTRDKAEQSKKLLISRYERVKLLLASAEAMRLKSKASRVWIEELEDVAFETEDFLDEWALKISTDEKSIMRKGKVRLLISCFSQAPAISLRLKNIEERISHLVLGYRIPYDNIFDSEGVTNRRRTNSGSYVDELQVKGREAEKECLIPILLEAADKGVKVITILGAGGSGKTTLAKCLYNDYRVKEYFEVRKWVCVSDSFDPTMILRTLLEDDPNGFSNGGYDLSRLSELVRKQFFGKKFLLVLDDVLDNLLVDVLDKRRGLFWFLIHNVAPGSKILVTTVSKNVAKEAGSNHEHFIRPLLTSDCWFILKRIALSEKPRSNKEVRSIGRKFAKQCKGSPLVAETIGGLLQSKHTAQEWQEALDMEIWKNEDFAKRIYLHLYVSYQKLPDQLKRCFFYCAVFPKDTCIDVERLITLLITVGYLSGETRVIMLKGYDELAKLEGISFLTNAKRSIHKNKITSYKIPKLCHSFAEYIRPDLTMIGQLEKLGRDQTRSMRSFVILSPCKLPQGLFKKLKYVRALVLSCCGLEELSSDVSSLKFLRFLDLSANPLKELPGTICMLLFLQSLYLHSCYQLTSLPRNIGDVGLRHLRINYTADELHNLPRGFGDLTSILTLDVFRIGGKYKNVEMLRNLNDLEDIHIAVHGEVKFLDADLGSKSKMENLELCFVGEGRDREKAACTENLVPPPNLKMLKLEDYPRVKLPGWILSESLIKKLKRLSLRSAANISSFPALWKLSSLEFLWLYDLPNVTCLGREFFGFRRSTLQQHHSKNQNQNTWSYPQISRESDDEDVISDYDEEDGEDDQNATLFAFRRLMTLRIEHLEYLTTWEDVDEAGNKKLKAFLVLPSLEEIIIADCPMLKPDVLPHRILGNISSLKITIDGKPVDTKTDSTGDKPSTSKGKAVMHG